MFDSRNRKHRFRRISYVCIGLCLVRYNDLCAAFSARNTCIEETLTIENASRINKAPCSTVSHSSYNSIELRPKVI